MKRKTLKLQLLGLSSNKFCFDKSAIEFDQFFKPSKQNQYFMVGLFHKYLSSN